MRCQTCGTDTPGASPTHICQHCGHVLGAAESLFDRLLEAIGNLAHTTDRLAQREANASQAIPQDQTFPFQVVIPTPTATAIANIDGPSLGRVWNVRRAVVGGVTANTAAAGSAYIFKQGAPPADLNIANLCDTAPAMPNVAFYGKNEFVVRGGENIWVAIVGGTAGQQYAGAIQIEDWAEADYNNPRINR